MSVSTQTITFSACAAIVFSAEAFERSMLIGFANRLGFAAAVDYTQTAKLDPHLLQFYFIHGAVPDKAKTMLLQSIRNSPLDQRKYAPVVCLLPGGPRHLLIHYVEMGFDEVLFLTDPDPSAIQKLEQQLYHEHIYVQTSNYLGPDRRRLERVKPDDPRRKNSTQGFRRISVHRDPRTGIQANYLF